MQAQILVHERDGGIPIVGPDRRQGSQRIGTEALGRLLAGFAMEPLVGHFGEPLADLPVGLGQVGDLAPRPEVLAQVADAGPLHFSLLPGRGHMTGARHKAVFAGEGKKARMEADQVAFVLGHRGGQVVVGQLARYPAQHLEGVEVAADEGLETLAMRELHVQHAAVALYQREGVQLALVALIVERTEMAPVDLEAIPGRQLDPHIGPPGGSGAHLAQVLLEDGDAAVVALGPQALQDHDRAGFRVLLQRGGDGGFEGVEFAWARAADRGRRWPEQIAGYGAAVEMEVARDPAERPLLVEMQAMNGVDLLGRQHGWGPSSVMGQFRGEHQQDVLCKTEPGRPADPQVVER